MKVKTRGLIFICFISLLGCKNEFDENSKNKLEEVKDTINVSDIIYEFDKSLNPKDAGVNLHFYDKNYQPVVRINKGDSIFVKVDYNSDQFVGLEKNHVIELYYAKGDFTFLGKDRENNYKMAIGPTADTIEFDIFLKSKKYIFNDYFIKNGKIKYYLTRKILLCRKTVLLINKST
jgi:hypothetical protein